MANKLSLIIFVMIVLFIFQKVQCKFEKIKFFLKNYEFSKNTEIMRTFRSKFFSIEDGERTIQVIAFKKTFVIDLHVFYPREDAEISYVSKLLNNTASFLESHALLYQGQVRDVEDSYVVGFFTKNNLFRGYVITDEVYCIEPYEEKRSIIIYKFKDIIVPGCSSMSDGDDLDCTETKYFMPWKPNKPPPRQNYSAYSLFYDKYLELFNSLQARKESNEKPKEDNSKLKGKANGTQGHKANLDNKAEKRNGTNVDKTSHHDDKSKQRSETDGGKKNLHKKAKNEKKKDKFPPKSKKGSKDDSNVGKGKGTASLKSNENDLEQLSFRNHRNSSHHNNKTFNTSSKKKKNSGKKKKNQHGAEADDDDVDDDDDDDNDNEVDRFYNDDYLELQMDPKDLKQNSTLVNTISKYYNTSKGENQIDTFFRKISFLESTGEWKKSSNEKLTEHGENKEEREDIDTSIMKALNEEPIDLECILEIVTSPTLGKKFKNRNEDMIKDIFIQITLMNKIFRKVFLERKNNPFYLNLKIQTIVIYGDEVYSPFKANGDLEHFVKTHRPMRQFCFSIGIVNQFLRSGDFFDGYIPEGGGGVCANSGNVFIVSHGSLDTPAPMGLYFAALMRGITRGLGANDVDTECEEGSFPNPMQVLQDYLLAKEMITPGTGYSIFTECNIQEIAKVLKQKECLLQIEEALCGNAIIDEGEECDCGPNYICTELDPCCTSTHTAAYRSKKKKGPPHKGCKLLEGATCGVSQQCCNSCEIDKEKNLCYSGPGTCDIAFCDGKSASCPSGADASNGLICGAYNESFKEPLICKDNKCELGLCTGFGLEPCFCGPGTGKDCVYCCRKDGKCKAVGDLELVENRGEYPLLDGTECIGGTCSSGKCVTITGEQRVFNFSVPKPPRFPVSVSDGDTILKTLNSIFRTVVILLILQFT